MRFFTIDFTISGDHTPSTRPSTGSLTGPFPSMDAARAETLRRHPDAAITSALEHDD